jgi:hypothetical protein
MKSSFKMALLSPPVSAFLFLIVVLLISCGTSPTNPQLKPLPVAIIYVNDSSGPQPILHTSVAFPSGTTLQGTCKSCADSSGNTGSGKVVFSATLNTDIPANTDIILHVVSK